MNTVEVRQGNVYLTINAEDVDRYMAKGFDVVDEAGNVIKKSVPNDINVLRQAYEQHTAEIAKLREENESLKAQLKKAKPKAEPKPEPEPEPEPAKVVASVDTTPVVQTLASVEEPEQEPEPKAEPSTAEVKEVKASTTKKTSSPKKK